MALGWQGVDEPVAHRLVADVGHLFEGDVANTWQHNQA
jgi:hypothetical protein